LVFQSSGAALEIAAEQPIETDVIFLGKIQKLISRIALDLGQILLRYLPVAISMAKSGSV
jgi:hypothetical protein